MDLKKANIDNLTSLWRVGGQKAGIYFSNGDYSLSIVEQSEWPNKLWFHTKPDKYLIEGMAHQWNLNSITIPAWGGNLEQVEPLLEKHGFKVKSELIGMSIALVKIPEKTDKLFIQKVTSTETAKTWSQVFKEAFGYQIHPFTVEQTMDTVDYFIGKYREEPIGTAVLYQDVPEIVGIHSMGILPSQRRKGYAADLLFHLLSLAKRKGVNYGTLQASSMGKGLYLKTGFQEDFLMKNYVKR